MSVHFFCLFVSNKRQNSCNDRAHILCCGTSRSHDPREGLWMLKIKKLCIQKFLGFCKILKIDTIILLNPRTFFFVFVLLCTKRRCAKIEPQSKVETKDGREAP